jgi:hypothetical protein
MGYDQETGETLFSQDYRPSNSSTLEPTRIPEMTKTYPIGPSALFITVTVITFVIAVASGADAASRCSADKDCSGCETCVDGNCVKPLECPPGMVRNEECECVWSATGARCRTNTDCLPGSVCRGGRCVSYTGPTAEEIRERRRRDEKRQKKKEQRKKEQVRQEREIRQLQEMKQSDEEKREQERRARETAEMRARDREAREQLRREKVEKEKLRQEELRIQKEEE